MVQSSVKTMSVSKLLQTPEIPFSKQWRAVLAEFVATLILVLFGCMSCIPIDDRPSMVLLFGSLGYGITVMINMQIFGHISGAFMNPVIAAMAVIWGKIPFTMGLAYMVAECAGAIAGYGILMLISPGDVAAEGVCLTVPHEVTDVQAFGIELLLTMAISLLCCSVLDPATAHNTDSLPLKFGSAIVGLSLAGAFYSGGGLNPARALGPAVWVNKWDAHWVYWVGPIVGGLVPAIFYKYVWLQPAALRDGSISEMSN